MSNEKIDDKGLHIVLGISGLNDDVLKKIKETFNSKNIKINRCVSKYEKGAIEKYISENDDVDLLIVSEFLQSSNPYSISDYEKLNDLIPDLMIIPVISNEKKNSPYINKILALGIYTALFENDASIINIVNLSITGRTRKEARYYYGAESIKEIGKSADITTCVDYISFSDDGEEVKDRADYVRATITDKDFEVVISRLPQGIRDRLKVFEDYEIYFEGENRVHSDERRSIFSNKVFKTVFPSQEENTALSSLIKQEVQSAVKKVVIGFTGSQQRIGVTHQTIWYGNYLRSAGYKIAIVENEQNNNKSFHTIEKALEVKKHEGFFTYKDIDYYPSFNLSNLSKIFLKDYNFVLIDFGVFNENMSPEFGRCIAQIVVCGAKPWEAPMLESLMTEIGDEEVLKKLFYLFMFTAKNDKKIIIKNMDILSNVYFAEYQADPFDSEGCDAMKEILADYLPEEKHNRKERFFDRVQRLFE